MDYKSLIICIGALIITLIIFFSELIKKNNGNKNLYHNHKKLFSVIIYEYLYKFPLTRNYIYKLNKKYRLISPCDEKEAAKKTVWIALLSWLICGISAAVVILTQPSLSNALLVIETIIIINCEILSQMVEFYELKLLKSIMIFLSEVKHNYYLNMRIDDAVYQSLDNIPRNIRPHANNIYELLSQPIKDEDDRKYYTSVSNKHLKEFINLSVNVMENDDQTYDGKSLYARNIENLNREIEMEIDNKERLKMEFNGYILVAIFSIFLLGLVKYLAVTINEEMNLFYFGKGGFICDLAFIGIEALIYIMLRKNAEYKPYRTYDYGFIHKIEKIKFIKIALDNYEDKYPGRIKKLKIMLRDNGERIKPRTYLLRSFLLSLVVFIISFVLFFVSHDLGKKNLIYDTRNVPELTSSARESQYDEMKECVTKYTELFVKEVYLPNENEIFEKLSKEGVISNATVNKALAKEILRRLYRYDNEYFKYYELIICIFVSVLAYYFPNIMLWYNKTVASREIEDEVNQFNALIYMLMHIKSMTAKKILIEMEAFSVIFKQSIKDCINNYGAGDLEALLELKRKEKEYEPFTRIVDNLIRCDEMPLEKAFDEVEIERENIYSRRKRENERTRKKRINKGFILAIIPIGYLILYFSIPLFMNSFSNIESLLNELSNI